MGKMVVGMEEAFSLIIYRKALKVQELLIVKDIFEPILL